MAMAPSSPTPKVAILVNTSNDWGRRLVRGIIAYANEVGPWNIWVRAKTPNVFKELPEGWQGDGIITTVTTPEYAKVLNDSGLHVVDVSDIPVTGFSAPCVRTDDRAGSQLALKHFQERGIRNLAFVGPSDRDNPVWYRNTYKQLAADAGLSCPHFDIGKNSEGRSLAFSKWLKALPKPVGILALSSNIARDVVETCIASQIKVPHDAAVLCSANDELLSHACFPALSGLQAPTEEIGYRAAQLLHQQLLGNAVPHRNTYLAPTEVVMRLSTDMRAVNDPHMLRLMDYIQAHALEPITMSDLLKAVPMSRRSLERHFESAFGHSPFDEIRRIRINRARKLLSESDLDMQMIAESSGYGSYSYLSTVFKKSTGLTPGQYRRQVRLKDKLGALTN